MYYNYVYNMRLCKDFLPSACMFLLCLSCMNMQIGACKAKNCVLAVNAARSGILFLVLALLRLLVVFCLCAQ